MALLQELHAVEMPLFVLTNCSDTTFLVPLERFDFLDVFEGIVASGKKTTVKLDLEIFEILEICVRHMGNLDDWIVIDDNHLNVQSATISGMDAITCNNH